MIQLRSEKTDLWISKNVKVCLNRFKSMNLNLLIRQIIENEWVSLTWEKDFTPKSYTLPF